MQRLWELTWGIIWGPLPGRSALHIGAAGSSNTGLLGNEWQNTVSDTLPSIFCGTVRAMYGASPATCIPLFSGHSCRRIQNGMYAKNSAGQHRLKLVPEVLRLLHVPLQK